MRHDTNYIFQLEQVEAILRGWTDDCFTYATHLKYPDKPLRFIRK